LDSAGPICPAASRLLRRAGQRRPEPWRPTRRPAWFVHAEVARKWRRTSFAGSTRTRSRRADLWHNDSYTYCRCPTARPKPRRRARRARLHENVHPFCQPRRRTGRPAASEVLLNLLAYAHTTNCPPDAERPNDNVLVGLCLFPRPSQRTMRPLETSPQTLDSNLRVQIPRGTRSPGISTSTSTTPSAHSRRSGPWCR